MAKRKTAPAAPPKPVPKPERYGKRAILLKEEYRHRADLMNALLVDGETYTLDEAKAILERHLKGRVN